MLKVVVLLNILTALSLLGNFLMAYVLSSLFSSALLLKFSSGSCFGFGWLGMTFDAKAFTKFLCLSALFILLDLPEFN